MAGARGASGERKGREVLSRRLGPPFPLPVAARRNVPGRACRRPAASVCRDSLRSPRPPAPLRSAQRRLFRPVHGPRRLLDHHLPAADVRAPARRASRARGSATRLAALHGADDLAALLMGSERQLLVSWNGRDGEPRFEGDPSIVGENATAKRALAFGTWLAPADAAAVESALEHLRQRGEAFRLTARTPRARLHRRRGPHHRRARDPAPARRHRRPLRAAATRAELSAARSDLRSMTTLLDTIAHPLWIRDADERLLFANQAYLRAVDASELEDAVARSLELLDAPTREEARRQRRRRRLSMRASPPSSPAGAHVLDVAERPTAGRQRRHRHRRLRTRSRCAPICSAQMDAHVRTLDQLPTAVAIFDGAPEPRLQQRRLSAPLAASIRPSSPQSPTDGEVLDRLRAPRKLPEQADFRAWKADVLGTATTPSSRARPGGTCPTGARCASSSIPNPQGGVTYLFDDVSERLQLESQVHGAHPRAERDPRHPERGRRRVRLRRPPEAAQPRLRARCGSCTPEMRSPTSAYRRADQAPAVCSRRRTSPGSTSAARSRASPTCAWA